MNLGKNFKKAVISGLLVVTAGSAVMGPTQAQASESGKRNENVGMDIMGLQADEYRDAAKYQDGTPTQAARAGVSGWGLKIALESEPQQLTFRVRGNRAPSAECPSLSHLSVTSPDLANPPGRVFLEFGGQDPKTGQLRLGVTSKELKAIKKKGCFRISVDYSDGQKARPTSPPRLKYHPNR